MRIRSINLNTEQAAILLVALTAAQTADLPLSPEGREVLRGLTGEAQAAFDALTDVPNQPSRRDRIEVQVRASGLISKRGTSHVVDLIAGLPVPLDPEAVARALYLSGSKGGKLAAEGVAKQIVAALA